MLSDSFSFNFEQIWLSNQITKKLKSSSNKEKITIFFLGYDIYKEHM